MPVGVRVNSKCKEHICTATRQHLFLDSHDYIICYMLLFFNQMYYYPLHLCLNFIFMIFKLLMDFLLTFPGLKLQGATCKSNKLYLTSVISTDLPSTIFKWIRYVIYSCLNNLSRLDAPIVFGIISYDGKKI